MDPENASNSHQFQYQLWRLGGLERFSETINIYKSGQDGVGKPAENPESDADA